MSAGASPVSVLALTLCIRLPCAASRRVGREGGKARPGRGAGPLRIACFTAHPRLLCAHHGARWTRRRLVGELLKGGKGTRGDSCAPAVCSRYVSAGSLGPDYDSDDDSDDYCDSTRLSDAVAEAAAARIDLARSLQRERELKATVSTLQSEAASLQQTAERAVLSASSQLEARAVAAAELLSPVEADSVLRRSAEASSARVRELEDELAATTLRAERELREALSRVTTDAAATLATAVAEAKAVAAAAEARSAALDSQLVGTEELASRLIETLQAKASADRDVATLMTAGAALSQEAATLRVARAAAEERASNGEARSAAAEKSVVERVRDTLAAAESCVAAAEAVKVETEQRAAAAALRAAQELQAAQTRADVAEAELGRRELLLESFAEATAVAAAQRIELVTASERISALEAECAALREARSEADAAAVTAQSRALAAEAAVVTDVERLVAANDDKWRVADSLVAARDVQLPLELARARAELASAVATATAATEARAALEASAARQCASLQRALLSAERSLGEWQLRALALEGDSAKDEAAPRTPGRLRATLGAKQLRRLLAHGPRGEGGRAVHDLYADIEEAAAPEPIV